MQAVFSVEVLRVLGPCGEWVERTATREEKRMNIKSVRWSKDKEESFRLTSWLVKQQGKRSMTQHSIAELQLSESAPKNEIVYSFS